MKAAGVIVDDAAVTPRYVQGFRPERELPMIKRIAVGSLRNKLLLILPGGAAAQRAAAVAAHADPDDRRRVPVLRGRGEAVGADQPAHAHAETPVSEQGPEHEDALVGSAIRTDFILSAEIMVISLNEVADEPLLSRALILVFVALAITAGVYGVVGLIVKMDDVGLRLAQTRDGRGRVVRPRARARHAGRPVGALEGRDRRDALGRRAHPPGRSRRARRLRALRRGPSPRGGRRRRARRWAASPPG